MFNPASPLYIKPRLNSSFLDWAWAFNKSCSTDNVNRSIKVIKDINLMSVDLFSEIRTSNKFQFHLENKGLLMLCQTEKMLEEEIKMAEIASEEGLDVTELSADDLKKIEPEVAINAIGATHYKCDWHSTPHEFMREMYTWLAERGVSFLKNEKVFIGIIPHSTICQ